MKAESGKRDASIPHPSSLSKWPHRLAVVNAVATLLLLFVGGLVTSKGAGLAVPDWPTTFGANPFLYPWSKMVGDIFYEHSHRLAASAVGLLTILLTLVLWLRERARVAARRSVSEALDELIAEARAGASRASHTVTSVVGSIRIAAFDPGLTQADAAIRRLFSRPGTTRRPKRLAAARSGARRG